MRIDVIGRHLDITEAIRTFAADKAGKLPKHYDGVQQITLRLEQDARHKGFAVEVVVDVQKHDDFVANAKGEDLYACIDQAVDKAARQLTDFKERLKQGKRGSGSANGSPGPSA